MRIRLSSLITTSTFLAVLIAGGNARVFAQGQEVSKFPPVTASASVRPADVSPAGSSSAPVASSVGVPANVFNTSGPRTHSFASKSSSTVGTGENVLIGGFIHVEEFLHGPPRCLCDNLAGQEHRSSADVTIQRLITTLEPAYNLLIRYGDATARA